MKFTALAALTVLVIVDASAAGTSGTDGSDCSVIYCANESNLVCGSNGITYLNPCEFDKAKCRDSGLKVAYNGRCRRS
ncbi:hypothetical protein PHYSODRAFT_490751 [Phytophthora sojae]|uniref:Kazal-like domain-containing protein n=1 Tax=Phytophthora sojae (strain P6497) TaxID=1094619 RepID=G4Z7D4_PHYSP|nr:hypothetical protein PHYSODRAFT_490751 [Phytophthora sojae]EGZ19642.1 hypothetical protein PHYSODRAFT_490751 [Phytophthora sojae]|eukprot:XP_009522359.1 hypothetical protein PHYSODRAFT_490751 [Phytophthora sojae]